MTETLFGNMQSVITIVEILLYGGCLSWFIGKTYSGKRKLRKLIFFIYVDLYLIRLTVYNIPSWSIFLILFIILMLLNLKEKERKTGYLAFLIITWYCVLNICFLMVNSIYTIISDRVMMGVQEISVIYQRAILVYMIGNLLRMVLVYMMSFMLINRIKNHIKNVQGKEIIYLLLTPMAGVLFGNIIVKMLLVVKEGHYFSLYEEFPMFLWIIPVVAAIFYLGILFSVSAYSNMVDLQEEKKKNFVEEQQIQALKSRMEEVEQFYDTARKMKHEMRNHATTLKGLISQRAYEEVDVYMNHIEQGLEDQFDFNVRTGNAVTDVILNDARHKAGKAGIKFQAALNFENGMGIEAFDMGIVLNNLLGNAIEACGKQQDNAGWIEVTGKMKRKFFLLEVKNSMEGEIVLDEKSGLPKSTKEGGGSIHGIGLENVSGVADKYLGSMDIKAEGNTFCVTVMMQGNEK